MWNKWKNWLTNEPPAEWQPSLTASGISASEQYKASLEQYKAMQNAYQQMVQPYQAYQPGQMGLGAPAPSPKAYAFDLSDLAIREALRRMGDYIQALSQQKSMRQWRQQTEALRGLKSQPSYSEPYTTVTWGGDNITTDSTWYYAK